VKVRRNLGSLFLVIAVGAAVVGCTNNKNKKTTEPSASGQYPPMNQASLDIPTQPPAPSVQYTPPAQPVVYDPPPAAAPADQPVGEAVADASDSYSPPARAATPRRTASAGGTRYKVKKGESLWSIAQTRYGNGNKWKAIAAANPRIDPNRIQAGQTITLP